VKLRHLGFLLGKGRKRAPGKLRKLNSFGVGFIHRAKGEGEGLRKKDRIKRTTKTQAAPRHFQRVSKKNGVFAWTIATFLVRIGCVPTTRRRSREIRKDQQGKCRDRSRGMIFDRVTNLRIVTRRERLKNEKLNYSLLKREEKTTRVKARLFYGGGEQQGLEGAKRNKYQS